VLFLDVFGCWSVVYVCVCAVVVVVIECACMYVCVDDDHNIVCAAIVVTVVFTHSWYKGTPEHFLGP
jgi:hypothetical protein